MFPQTMFFPPVDPNCPCPPTPVPGALLLTGEYTFHIPATPQNNFNPDGELPGISTLLLTAAADSVITGMPGVDGQLLFIWNIDPTPDTITLSHADVLSAAANRFYLPGAVDLVLGQYDGVLLRYSASINGGVGGWLTIPG